MLLLQTDLTSSGIKEMEVKMVQSSLQEVCVHVCVCVSLCCVQLL